MSSHKNNTPKIKNLSPGQADEHVTRIIAFYALFLAAASITFNSYYTALLLAFDFSIRAFGNSKFSPLKLLALKTQSWFKVPVQPVYAGPKKFAALLGFLFSLLIAGSEAGQFHTATGICGGLFIFCAALESFFGICIGCYVFSFIQKFNFIKTNN